MGRAFEFRKGRKMKRWDAMAKGFTKMGKEIAISVKLGGPDPNSNARLRMAMQNSKAINMPKDRIEAAIKRASSKEEKDLEEIVYEGYGPHGIGILVECASDNPIRTVANVRMHFNRGGGELGKTGSLSFMFDRKGVFKLSPEGLNLDDLELELIDFGLEEIKNEDGDIMLYTEFNNFGMMQKALEEKKIPVITAELQRIANTTTALTDAQAEEVISLIERLEEDDDVQAVYYNLKD